MFIQKDLERKKMFKDEYLPSNKELIRSMGLKRNTEHPDRVDPYMFGETSNTELTKQEQILKERKEFEKKAKEEWQKEQERRNKGE